jgi:two-component system, chemotaxis family, sensor kinase CheA
VKAETIAQFQSFGEKIAMEAGFAEVGTNTGLLPINSFVCMIEEVLGAEVAPEAVKQGVQEARRWIETILDGSGVFSQADLDRFRAWAIWWDTAMEATEMDSTVAAFPGVGEKTSLAGESPALVYVAPSAEELALSLNLEQDGEFLTQFISESEEHLQNIEQGVLALENNPGDAETLNLIFRAFHTFKGNSGFFNLTAIQNLAHELESLLELARQRKLAMTRRVIDLILAGADTLKQFVLAINARINGEVENGPILIPTSALMARVRAVVESPEPLKAEELASLLPRPSAEFETMTEIVAATVKVDKTKLDNLVDLMGEMVLAQTMVMQNHDWSALRSEKLNRDLARLDRVTKDLKHTAISLRMVPIRKTFQKMHRLVRDVAATLGKDVQLVSEGEDTEVDRGLIEEINDPLIHMIRNSIDHGMENAEVRRQRGKVERGTIRLRAFHQGGSVVIQIKDDGKGLDREKILGKAMQMGLVKPGQHLAEKDVFNLIMSPGFSTAERVTDLSGRGVGLDVVRRNVEILRGKIEIQSTAGQGSTFTIHLPLTMAIIDGVIAGVGEHRFIIPTLAVGLSFRPMTEAIKTVQGQGEMIDVRGKLRPLLRLHSHLGIKPTSTAASESIAILIEAGGQSRCVLVDQLLGKQEVVIKTLGETFRRSSYVTGAAILGDGRVALILDPHALVCLESAPLEAAA